MTCEVATSGYGRCSCVRHGAAAGFPLVKGRCPACGRASLFLGAEGHVTCTMLGCPDPCAADALERAGYALVPRAALEHVLDWHNKRPCGDVMESYDELVFAALTGGSTPETIKPAAENDPEQAR